MNKTTNPLGDAITVLKHIRIADPSTRPDTEDAANRVALALEYLALANEIMRSLAKDNYVQGVIMKLGDYDRAEMLEARKVVDAARDFQAGINEQAKDTPDRARSLRLAVEAFDLWERATRFAREPGKAEG